MALVTDRVRLADAVRRANGEDVPSSVYMDDRHLERQSLFDRRRDPRVVGTKDRLGIGNLDSESCGGIGQSGRLPTRITAFRDSNQKDPARGVREHRDVQQELAAASIVLIVKSAFVFELEMLPKPDVHKPANVDFSDIPKCSSFPQHAVILVQWPVTGGKRLERSTRRKRASVSMKHPSRCEDA